MRQNFLCSPGCCFVFNPSRTFGHSDIDSSLINFLKEKLLASPLGLSCHRIKSSFFRENLFATLPSTKNMTRT